MFFSAQLFNTYIAQREVWILTYVLSEICLSTPLWEHFVAMLTKLRFESSRMSTQISSSAQLVKQMAKF